jgi:hypothetical protein
MSNYYRITSLMMLTAAMAQLDAQAPPPVHAIGPTLAISTEPMGSVSQVRHLSGGRVLVNDITGRRLLIFDSSLRHSTVIADSTGASGLHYSSRVAGIIAFRGDSTLFADPITSVLVVLDAAGKVTRTLAPPSIEQINSLVGGPYGTPGFDAKGRIVYRARIPNPPDTRNGIPLPLADSALIIRFDFVTRKQDTVVKFGIPAIRRIAMPVEVAEGTLRGVSNIIDPVSWTDAWAVLSDGTIAIVRGRDYRVDFIDGDDRKTPGLKIPFNWHRLTDEEKSMILDSTRVATDKAREEAMRRDSIARAGSPRSRLIPLRPDVYATLSEMPDYLPPFLQGAALADGHDRLWVRTSQRVGGGAVYDVIDRSGALIDRLIVPPGRVIAGFGPDDEIYMGVLDGTTARLERARAH